MEYQKNNRIIEVSFIVLLVVLYFVSKGIADRIWFAPSTLEWINSDWLLGKGEYAWYNRSWLLKYPLSFISDGWHFFDALRNSAMSLLVVVTLKLKWYWFFVIILLGGIIFELTYNV